MTLIAVLYADHTPLVVTDSLISAPSGIAFGVPSPLLGDLDQRGSESYSPIGLARKFWRLPDGSLYFYSGVVGHARQMFDYLCGYLSVDVKYSRELHTEAQEYSKRITGGFSFIVCVQDGDDVMLLPYGNVRLSQDERYGCMALLGSGTDDVLNIMKASRVLLPDGEDARLVNAYQLAARLTLDYVDAADSGSAMSAADCGGYFEVVEPVLYSRPYSRFYRGTAHVFLEVAPKEVKLKRFVASSQGDDVTHILNASDPDIYLQGSDFLLDTSLLTEYIVTNERSDSQLSRPFAGSLPFAHIRGVIVYATMVPVCGIEQHRIRTHHVIVGPGGPAATLLESDDYPMAVHVSLFSESGCPVSRVAERLRFSSRSCPLCEAASNES